MSIEQSSLTTSDIYVTARKQHSSKGGGDYQAWGAHNGQSVLVKEHQVSSKNSAAFALSPLVEKIPTFVLTTLYRGTIGNMVPL